MRTTTLMRHAMLVSLLAGALPAPASAQFGTLKRRLKEKIVNTVVDNAAKKIAGGDSAATTAPAGTASAGTAAAGAPRARKGAPTPAPAAGLEFNEWVLEITPDVLDRLERGLAAAAAVGKAVAEGEKYASPKEWDRCRQTELERVEKKFRATVEAGNEDTAVREMTDFRTHEAERIEARCGVDPREAGRRRSDAGTKAYRESIAASGLGDRQYAIVKERVEPFCALGAAEEAGTILRIPAGSTGQFLVYSPAEIATMKQRCARLLPLFKAGM